MSNMYDYIYPKIFIYRNNINKIWDNTNLVFQFSKKYMIYETQPFVNKGIILQKK